MGKLEDTIYENYRQAIAEGDFEQARMATELGKYLREYIDLKHFKDYNTLKVPASQIIGSYFNPFPYSYDPEKGVVKLDTSVITLTETENRLFYLFSKNETKGTDIKVVTKKEIANHLWGTDEYQKSALRLAIFRLRKKIEPDPNNPQILISLPPRGYIFLGNKTE